MDNGTKLRTILAIATSLNTALIATDLTGFQNEKVDLVYKIASLILNFVIVAIATYFNNDYTEQGAVGTDVTRRLKEDPDAIVYIENGDDDDLEEFEDEDENESEWYGVEDDMIVESNDPEEGEIDVLE